MSLLNWLILYVNPMTQLCFSVLPFPTLVQEKSALPRGFVDCFLTYTDENKARYGLVATNRKVLKKAFEEAMRR